MPLPYRFVFFILIFNVAWDFFSIFYEDVAVLPVLRGVFIAGFSFYCLAKSPNNRVKTGVLLFIVYIICLFPFSGNPSYSISTSFKVFLSLMMLPLGFFLINNITSFKHLARGIYWLAAFLILGFLASNIFGLGGMSYSDKIEFDTGAQGTNWNVLTYILLSAPLFYFSEPSIVRRRIMYLMLVALSIFLLISFKRISISGVVFGYAVFLLFYRRFGQFLKVLIILLAALAVLSPLYLETVQTVYKAREDRFQEGALQKEGRYLETLVVWSETMSFEDPVKSLFGGQAFNSVGNYADGRFGKRQVHSDYNLILNTNGIIGLILYLNIYWQVFRQYQLSSKIKFKERQIMVAVFWALFLTTLYSSIAGQIHGITFRSIAFLFMGAILGVLSNRHALASKSHAA